MEEHEVDREVLAADLHRVLRTDKARVPSQLRQEAAKVPKERAMEVGLGVIGGEAEELDVVGVLELVDRRRVKLSHRWRDVAIWAILLVSNATAPRPALGRGSAGVAANHGKLTTIGHYAWEGVVTSVPS